MKEKWVLLWGLAGIEPAKEILVALGAIKRLGFKTLLILNREYSYPDSLVDEMQVSPNFSWSEITGIKEKEVSLALLMTDLASHQIGKFNQKLSLPGPDHEQFYQLNDKLAWSALARKHGLKMPKEFVYQGDWKLFPFLGPFIVKPSKSTAGISHFDCGYQYFSSLNEFLDSFSSSAKRDQFEKESISGGLLGKYFFQEAIPNHFWGNVCGTFIDNNFFLHEVNCGLYYPYPDQTKIYGTYGPVEMKPHWQQHINRVVEIIKSTGFKNSAINFDLIDDGKGNLYTIDINPRVSGSFSVVSPHRSKIQYWDWYIESLLGLSETDPPPLSHYNRRLIRGVTTDSLSNDENHHVNGLAESREIREIPKIFQRKNWPLEVIVTGHSVHEILNRGDEFERKALKI